MSLKGKVLFITGASRGIGKAIGLRAARDGARIVIAAKTAEAHSVLPGTIHSAAEEMKAAGGEALAIQLDIRDDAAVAVAMKQAADHFGGIDILVNNASAINLTRTPETPMKRFDLMFGVNVRGTYACSQAAIPYLRRSKNPHVLTLSPPINLNPVWFKDHVAYTMSKYGMSLSVLGMAEEFRKEGIAFNALWPRTVIDTAALRMIPGMDPKRTRKPEILSDAAYIIFNRPSRECTGNFFIDEDVLASAGIKDLGVYSVEPGATQFHKDLFVD